MKTALSLQMASTPGAMERLWQFLDERVPTVEAEGKQWRDKLEIYEKEADNQFGHRTTGAIAAEDKTIFDLKNHSINMVRGVARYMRGRCEGDIFGGSPWFFAKAEGLGDADLATAIQKHLDFKFRQGRYREAGKNAINHTIDFGTAVLKTTWKITAEPYERLSTVFHGPDDQPVLHPDPDRPSKGDYLEDGHPALTADPDGTALYQPPAVTAPPAAPDPTGLTPPTIPVPVLPPAIMGRMKQRFITEPNVKYEGLSVETIPYKNLIAPMEIERLEDADVLGHKYSMAYFDVVSHYAPDKSDPELLKALQNLQNYNSDQKIGDEVAKGTETPVTNFNPDVKNPRLNLHELRLRFDPLGRGSRRIYVVVHMESRTLIHIDYQGNMTPGGDLDMHPVVINKVPSRWYGRGYFEIYQELQRLIDGTLNAIVYHNQFVSDPPKEIITSLCEETEQKGGEIVLTPGKLFRRKPGANPDQKLIQVIELPDLDTRTWQLLELFQQILQQDSGVTAAAQGDPGALPSVATATGTQAILSSGSTMHQLVIDDLKEGLEPALSFAMRLVYSRQDDDETYSYMQGDQSTQDLLTLSDAQTLSKLYLHVSLSLTRIKSQELRDAASQLIDRTIQYATLPPPVQVNARPGYIQFAQSLGFDDCDRFFPEPPPMLPPPGLPGQPPQPGAPTLEAGPASGDVVPPAEGAPTIPALPAPSSGGGPALPNILTTGASFAPSPAPPQNVVPAIEPLNQAGLTAP